MKTAFIEISSRRSHGVVGGAETFRYEIALEVEYLISCAIPLIFLPSKRYVAKD